MPGKRSTAPFTPPQDPGLLPLSLTLSCGNLSWDLWVTSALPGSLPLSQCCAGPRCPRSSASGPLSTVSPSEGHKPSPAGPQPSPSLLEAASAPSTHTLNVGLALTALSSLLPASPSPNVHPSRPRLNNSIEEEEKRIKERDRG